MAGARLVDDGYATATNLIEARELDRLRHHAESAMLDGAGTRRMLELDWCTDLAERLVEDAALRPVMPPDPVPVLCTLFAKSPANNWLVALHQDLSIPAAARVPDPRCSGWSEKEGDLFVQPPSELLDDLLAVRLHLDDCDERNGALRVVPGSHRCGRLSAEEAIRQRDQTGEVFVPVAAGSAMLMRPLLLHASSKSIDARPRRVLHFVFGPAALPCGLRWPPRRR